MKLNKQKIITTYVNIGTKLVNVAVLSLNSYMKHLLLLKGLDPNSDPKDAYRDVLIHLFNHLDPQDFSEDFDLSWVGKRPFTVKLDDDKNDVKWQPNPFLNKKVYR